MNEKNYNFGRYFLRDTVNESMVWWSGGLWYFYGGSDNEVMTLTVRVTGLRVNEWWRAFV